MVRENKRPLKVFLCHASGDKPPVRDLYKRLTAEGVDAWLDKEKLLPGQDWRLEIPKAVREADVVVICLSKRSTTKEGYVQKEIKFALDIAEEKPEGTIFLIPARLEDCVVPERLNRWQWVDLYEDDGFIKLLRSLKLRADAVDATVEPTSYVDTDKETDRKLEQWYTEGLAAFYTEDWDRACQRFQSILSERPNHRNAAEKLEEAERQRSLSKLYEQASGAIRSEDWGTAIQTLDELSNKSADYKDTAQLLRKARKQKQISDLYAEAKALHAGQQWEAVVKVFEQISAIEPNYPDVDGLLPSAQKEVAELKRVAELNEQYSHALREMDAGNWHEARRLLEAVHKSETGFLETEKLLKKVENEIVKEEQRRKQNDQINTLYEQAHGLLRSKKWRNALDKMGEIRKLDEHFHDTDGITEKAQKELAREEQEAERQNKLAALYAEAVKLLKEEKYQEALDKWGEIKAIDPKYPDRQRVHNTARKALTRQAKPISAKSRFIMPKLMWIGLGGIGAIAILIFAINQFGNGGINASLAPTKMPTQVSDENTTPLVPSTTNVPQRTGTPRPTTLALTPLPVLPEYDNFDDASLDGGFDSTLWQIAYDGGVINQKDGNLVFHIVNEKNIEWLYAGLIAKDYANYRITHPISFEAKMSLDTTDSAGVFMQLESVIMDSKYAIYTCGIERRENLYVKCTTSEREGFFEDIFYGEYVRASWHTFRFTVDPDKNEILFFMDDKLIGSFASSYPDSFSNTRYRLFIQSYVYKTGVSSALVDYVRIDEISP